MSTATSHALIIREVPYDLGELSFAPQPGDHSPGLWCEASDGSDGAAVMGAVANAVAFFKDALGHDLISFQVQGASMSSGHQAQDLMQVLLLSRICISSQQLHSTS